MRISSGIFEPSGRWKHPIRVRTTVARLLSQYGYCGRGLFLCAEAYKEIGSFAAGAPRGG